MIFSELKKIKTEKKNLRQFVVLCFLFLSGLGGIWIYHDDMRGYWFCGAGLIIGMSGWVWPFLLKPFYLVWMGFAVILGHFVSQVVLIATFYGVIMPLGFAFRLFDRKSSQSKKAISFWVIREDFSSSPEKYERQF